MDKVTQANAASAEESASAAEELSSQSVQLSEIVTELVSLVAGVGQKRTAAGTVEPRRLPTPKTHTHPQNRHTPPRSPRPT